MWGVGGLGVPLQSNSSWFATAAAPEWSTSTSARRCLFHSTSRKYSSLRCLQTCGFQNHLFSPLKSCTFSTHFWLELKYSSGLSTLLLFLVLLTNDIGIVDVKCNPENTFSGDDVRIRSGLFCFVVIREEASSTLWEIPSQCNQFETDLYFRKGYPSPALG